MRFTKPECLKLCHELWIHVYETGNKAAWPREMSLIPDTGVLG